MPAPTRPAPTRGLPLLVSNAIDAASRQCSDLAIDVLAVVTLGATTIQTGLLNALGTAGFLILGIPIGVLIDRAPSVRTISIAGLARSGIFATVVLAWSLGSLTMWHVYAAAFAAGVAGVFTETAQTAITPRVAHTGGVPRLVSAMQTAESVIGLAVPAAAGAAMSAIGAGPLLAIAAALTATAALVVLRQRTRSPGTTPVERDGAGSLTGLFTEARDGWATLRGRRELWRLTLAALLVNFGLAVHSAIEVVLVLRTLALEEAVLGLIVSAGALGGLLGAVVALPLAGRFSHRTAVRGLAAGLPLAAGLTLVALLDPARATFWLAAGALGWGVFVVAFNILLAGLAADLTPERLLGRVAATRRTLTMGIVPAGSLVGGFVGDAAGIGAAVGIWVLLSALAALLTARAFAPRG